MLELGSPPAEFAPVVPPAQSIIAEPTLLGGERRNSKNNAPRRRASGVSSAVVVSQPRRRSLESYQEASQRQPPKESLQQQRSSSKESNAAIGRPRRASAGLALDAPEQSASLVVSAGVAKWGMGNTCFVNMTKVNMRRLLARLDVLAQSFREDLDNKAVVIHDELSSRSLDDLEMQCTKHFDVLEHKAFEVASLERRSSEIEISQHMHKKAVQTSAARYTHEISRLTAQLEKVEKQRTECERRRLALEMRFRVVDSTTMRHVATQTEQEA